MPARGGIIVSSPRARQAKVSDTAYRRLTPAGMPVIRCVNKPRHASELARSSEWSSEVTPDRPRIHTTAADDAIGERGQ